MSRRRRIESTTCSSARSSTRDRGRSRRGGLAPLRARERVLAGELTLVNVMKARAAAPDVLVDLADLEELRAIGFSSDGLLEIGAVATYAQVMGSSEVEVARPILARSLRRSPTCRCEIAAPSEVTSASAIRRTTCLRCWLHSTRRSRSAAPAGERVRSGGRVLRRRVRNLSRRGRTAHEDLGAAGGRYRRRVLERHSGRTGRTSLTLPHPFPTKARGSRSGAWLPPRCAPSGWRRSAEETSPEPRCAKPQGAGRLLDPPSDVHGRRTTGETWRRRPRYARSCKLSRGKR